MSISKLDTIDEIILKKDLYKDNTLLLKKGSILNAYILNKLSNFGIQPKPEKQKEVADFLEAASATMHKEVLILQQDKLKSLRTKEILKHAGFSNENIVSSDTYFNFHKNPALRFLSYIFVDSSLYCEAFLQEALLLKLKNKIKIFVMNCDELEPENLDYNTDFLNIKFLHRPLANNYIKALLRLYS